MVAPRRRQKGGAGKKRIDTTKLIQDPAARQTATSKRRTTLLNMASDLSALTGAHTAIVVFSSSKRGTAYAFGSPSVDAVLQWLSNDAALPVVVEDEGYAARVAALRQELQDTKALVKAEKKRIKDVEAGVKRGMEAARTTMWWQADVNALGPAELPEYEAALLRLKDAIQRHVDVLQAVQNGAGFTTSTTAGGVDSLHADHNN